MYPYIICYSCGYCIGAVYDAFIAMKQAEIERQMKAKGRVILPEMMALAELNIELGSILDALCIESTCCRAHIMTQVEFKSVY